MSPATRPSRRAAWRGALAGSLCAAALLCGTAAAQTPAPPSTRPEAGSLEPIVVKVRLNGVNKGERFAHKTAQGDFYFKLADLRAMGVTPPAQGSVAIEGEPHLSIGSIAGAELSFLEKTLELEIRLPPELLPRQSIDLGAAPSAVPVAPRGRGGFLNYRLGYSEIQGSGASYNLATELGVDIGPALLLDNRDFGRDASQGRSTRLQTRLIYDEVATLRRWVAGDTLAASGDLGGMLNLGGVGVSKVYQIDPYLVKQPLAGFSGAVALPSSADIYVDGVRVRSERLAPGAFSLRNLATAYPGLHDIDIVVRDPFGREQRVAFPYFYTEQLLADGLHEYSYAAGVQRENYGLESNAYGRFAASAMHRYGWSDALTAGFGGEATRTHFNMGPRLSASIGRAGVVSGGVAASRDQEPAARGTASSLAHGFARRQLSTHLALRRYGEGYSVAGFQPLEKPRRQASASIAWGHARAGTFSLAHSLESTYGATPERRTTTLGYNRTLIRSVSLFAQLSRVTQDTTGHAVFVGLTYSPARGMSASAQHQSTQDGQRFDLVSAGETVPAGEGLGYRVLAQRSVLADQTTSSVSPFVQYNSRHASWIAEGTSVRQSGAPGSSAVQLSVAGAVARIADDFHPSRPIQDSYGLVRLGAPLAGVRVMTSGTEIGRTDASGSVFVPNLGSYQVTQIGIQPKDVPLEYSISNSVRSVRPPLRSGTVAQFDMVRIRAIAGRLKLRDGRQTEPIEDDGLVLAGESGELRIGTVRGGGFYLENAAPGRYAGELTVQGKRCRVELVVRESADIVTDMGDIYCDAIR